GYCSQSRAGNRIRAGHRRIEQEPSGAANAPFRKHGGRGLDWTDSVICDESLCGAGALVRPGGRRTWLGLVERQSAPHLTFIDIAWLPPKLLPRSAMARKFSNGG